MLADRIRLSSYLSSHLSQEEVLRKAPGHHQHRAQSHQPDGLDPAYWEPYQAGMDGQTRVDTAKSDFLKTHNTNAG